MITISNKTPDKKVLEDEYKRLLGYPSNYQLMGRSRELADWARHWYDEFGRPWVYSYYTNEIKFSDKSVIIQGVEFSSEKIRNNFINAGAHSILVAAVSAGKELEEFSRKLWDEGKPDEYFFIEVYGSAVVEHLITMIGSYFCEWGDNNKLAVMPRYSPGYSGWSISDQIPLLNLIKKESNYHLPGEIDVFSTGMLNPKKSLLAVFGLTKNINNVKKISGMIPCDSCSLNRCKFRKSNFKKSFINMENIE